MKKGFFALISRMKYIGRWGLMRNSYRENIAEHSHMVAVLAHALATIGNEVFGKNINADRCASLALFHDSSEIITGDLPTPIKYHDEAIKKSYKEIEFQANERLLSLLDENLKPYYEPLLNNVDENLEQYVKAADKLSAYIKCLEERKAGNSEFVSAEKQIYEALNENPMEELRYFMENYIKAFEITLDELQK